jgi:hypothetical protein
MAAGGRDLGRNLIVHVGRGLTMLPGGTPASLCVCRYTAASASRSVPVGPQTIRRRWLRTSLAADCQGRSIPHSRRRSPAPPPPLAAPPKAGQAREAGGPAAHLNALHTVDGARKYLTTDERDAFLGAAERADRQTPTPCMTLAHAGCRLSEALALTADRVDLTAGLLVLESLKKARSRRLPRRAGCRPPCSRPSTWCTASHEA